MQPNKIYILCTRPLGPQLIARAGETGIYIDIVPFIKTESLESKELSERIQYYSSRPATVIFTSMNAAESVIRYLNGVRPLWRIFCLGNTTRKIVVQYFGESSIAGIAENASALAEKMVERGEVNQTVFFCGDQRRDELPTILANHHVPVDEVIVYRTVTIANKISLEYRGILFFSPSAVSAFFDVNRVTEQTDLFAIGQTTAEEIRKYTHNTVVVSDKASKEDLVEKMITYYQSLKREQISNRH